MSDYYSILEIERSSTPEQIKTAYRKLARKHHPDKGGDPEKFKKISEAYSVLSDISKRRQYDSGMGSPFTHVNPFDIFNQFFTGNNSYKQFDQPSITYTIGVTLEQIALEKKLNIKFKRSIRCETCQGRRTKNLQPPPICRKCGGRGSYQERLNLGGLIQLPKLTKCEICKGNGFTLNVNNKCNICSGEGKLPCENSVVINCRKALDVPSVCFPSEGHFNPHTNSYGKVVINFKIKKHDKFKKIGKYDISTHVNVSIIQTLIGCEGVIDHPNGHKVPFKTKTGEMISEGDICIIENEGLTSEGQLLIIFKVKKQKKLSAEVINDLREVFQKHNLL